MEMKAAGDSVLNDTAQGTLLVLERGTNNVCRKVKSPVVLVPVLKKNRFSSASTSQKGVKADITKNGSFQDLGSVCVRFSTYNNTKV